MQKRKVQPSPIVEVELYDDEDLLWQGKPNPITHARKASWIGVLFGLGFAAFAVFFISMALNMFSDSPFGGPPAGFRFFFLAIPTVFICVGLWQAAEPIRKFIEGSSTTYALTNKRALIITKTWTKQVRSYYDENIRGIQTRMNMDGTGDVIFSSRMVTRWIRERRRSYQTQIQVDEGFVGIGDAREVEDLMSQLFFDAEKAKPVSHHKPKHPTVSDLKDRFGDRQPVKSYSSAPKTSVTTSSTVSSSDEALAPALLDELANLRGFTPSQKQPSQKLIEQGYISIGETGAGGAITTYSLSQKGKDILKAYGR
jgi:hypothetical protein